MNILYINHYAGSPQHGMEYRPFYLAREWVRAGHQVTILAASFSHVRAQNPVLERNLAETWLDGVRYVWVKTPAYAGNGYRRVVNIFAFLAQVLLKTPAVLGSPDVIIGSSTYPLDVFAAKRLARRTGARVVYEVHDLWPLSLIELGGMSPRHPFVQLIQWGEDYAYRHADRVISMLPAAEAHMLARGMAEHKYCHIPNGVDIDEWENDNEPMPDELARMIAMHREQGRFLVGYAGAHGIANALDSLVKAGQMLQDEVTFFLVGQGPEKNKLQQQADQLDARNVLFMPTIARQAIPAFLRSMDALYIGLQREPLFRFGVSPNKLMDYMMAARPIVYAIEAGNDPVRANQCGVSVIPEDPDALCCGIQWLRQQSNDERDQMGQRGSRYVRQNHNYQSLAQQFIQEVENMS